MNQQASLAVLSIISSLELIHFHLHKVQEKIVGGNIELHQVSKIQEIAQVVKYACTLIEGQNQVMPHVECAPSSSSTSSSSFSSTASSLQQHECKVPLDQRRVIVVDDSDGDVLRDSNQPDSISNSSFPSNKKVFLKQFLVRGAKG
jgi:hypothetical protein